MLTIITSSTDINNILTKTCDVSLITNLENQMASFMIAYCKIKENNCVGLSANQVGYTTRFFVMESSTGYKKCFNPKILTHGKDIEIKIEGCKSYPDIWKPIKRYRVITVSYDTEYHNQVIETLKGFDARIFQHELDHLNGICKIKD